MSEEQFMRAAIEIARKGVESGQTPFGAAVIQGDTVIARDHNAVWGSMDITSHAEINAIRKACRALNRIDLSDCAIYSTCEPCPMCFGAIHWARIPVIYYGVSIEDAESFGFNEIHISNRTMNEIGNLGMRIESGILQEECADIFRLWQDSGLSDGY
jgi:tRNA(Arg) A34 adenosine deaminase TadA